MNPQIELLHQIAKKSSRMIIGLMSGTSMDGLDVALCRFEGSGRQTSVELLKFETIPFDSKIKTEIRKVFAQKQIDFQLLCMLNPWIANLHGDMVNTCLKKWNVNASEIDAIASHGQTVMHTPKRLHGLSEFPNATLQIGDGDHLAVKTGILTISDFRQKHCALGGEGAPLALYGDSLLFSSTSENRILINIGGIANYTWLPAAEDFDAVFATDTGPGNTLIDAYVKKHFNQDFDEDAILAKQGVCNEQLLQHLLSHTFFQEKHPKTTGPELFNLEYLANSVNTINTNSISHYNVLATLCHFTAVSLTDQIKKAINLPDLLKSHVYLSGGGMHNPLICELIKSHLPEIPISTMDKLGISGDAKEAVLFGVLANETLAGNLFSFGKISFPA